MWGALRSDLQEFASSIATDTNTIRNEVEDKIVKPVSTSVLNGTTGEGDAANLGDGSTESTGGMGNDADADDIPDDADYTSEAVDEVLARMDMEETYTATLLVNEVNGVNKNKTPLPTLPNADGKIAADDAANGAASEGTEGAESPKQGTEKHDSAPVEPASEPKEDGDGWGDDDDAEDEPFFDEDADDSNANSTAEEHVNVQEGASASAQAENTATTSDETPEEEDPAVLEFLSTFDIAAQTDDIGMVLEEHADTVGTHFQELVPMVVTYEQFWQRYYFRCDPSRVQAELDEENERLRQQRQEMLDKGKNTVKNLFGGALNVIKIGQETADQGKEESIYEKYQAELAAKQRALGETNVEDEKQESSTGFGALFRSARPPFVMNTAVDDDDDEDADDADQEESELEDDEDEDEEIDDFGWGSDDDDEEFSDEEVDDDESEVSEEVVFDTPASGVTQPNPSESKEMEELRDQLAKALQVKDEFQSKSDELEKLKLSLFEKDSELAAMKASLAEATEDSVNTSAFGARLDSQSAEMELLKSSLVEKTEQLENIKKNLSKTQVLQEEEDATDNAMLAEAFETITSLQTELESANTATQELLEKQKLESEAELNGLREEIQERVAKEDDIARAHASAEETIASLQAQIEEIRINSINTESSRSAECEMLQNELTEAKETITSLQSEFEAVKTDLVNAQALASASDSQESDTALAEAQKTISMLKSELEKSQRELVSIQTARNEDDARYSQTLLESQDTISSLQSELVESKSTITALHAAQTQSAAEAQNAAETIAEFKFSAAGTSDMIESLQARLNEALSELESSKDGALHLQEKDLALVDANEKIAMLEQSLQETERTLGEQVLKLTAESQEMSGRMSQIKEQAENAAKQETIKEQQWMAEKIELQNATEEWKKKARTWEEKILNHKMEHEKELSELRAQLEARGDSFSSGVDVDMVVDDAVNNQVPPTIVQEDTKSNDVDDNGDEEDEGWGDEGWSDDEDI